MIYSQYIYLSNKSTDVVYNLYSNVVKSTDNNWHLWNLRM